jgi:hypothetical protein
MHRLLHLGLGGSVASLVRLRLCVFLRVPCATVRVARDAAAAAGHPVSLFLCASELRDTNCTTCPP